MMSSEFDDWNTPEVVLAPVREFIGGDIGLDPCSNAQSIVRARVEYRLDFGQDGLLLPWNGLGLVFLNPPYGDEIGAFMRRASKYGAEGVEIIALVPNRSDTVWYQDNIGGVAAKCEWRGRLAHPRGRADQRQRSLFALIDEAAPDASAPLETGTAPFPSALLYWGPMPTRFSGYFNPFGKVWF
jgi:site-specific DNA-methyltransferase (adenine-specific)